LRIVSCSYMRREGGRGRVVWGGLDHGLSAATVLHHASATKPSARSSGSGFLRSTAGPSSLRDVGFTTRWPICESSVIIGLFSSMSLMLYHCCTNCGYLPLMVGDKCYMYVNLHYRTYRIYQFPSVCSAFTTWSNAGSSRSSVSSSESLILAKFTCILATLALSLFHVSLDMFLR
jgi:hypothetical protein